MNMGSKGRIRALVFYRLGAACDAAGHPPPHLQLGCEPLPPAVGMKLKPKPGQRTCDSSIPGLQKRQNLPPAGGLIR